MEALLEDFLQHLRNERGHSERTQQAYSSLLKKFIDWAAPRNLTRWENVELSHLTDFLLHEQRRAPLTEPKGSTRKLSSSSLYLQIAALRSFFRFCETEKLLPLNLAENLSLPRCWRRLPKSLSDDEISQLLADPARETPRAMCDRAILEWRIRPACVCLHCAICGWNSCTWMRGL